MERSPHYSNSSVSLMTNGKSTYSHPQEGFRSSNRESTTKLTVDQKATEENFFINNRIWGGICREECFGTALLVSARKSQSIHIDGDEKYPLLSNTSRRMTYRWRFVLTRLCNVTRQSPRLSNEMQRLAINRGSKRLEEVGSLVRNEHLFLEEISLGTAPKTRSSRLTHLRKEHFISELIFIE